MTVTGYGDRACVAGAGTTVLLDCFRISAQGKLDPDFDYDLEVDTTASTSLRGVSGVSSVQFSPDGEKLAVLSKGSVDSPFPFSPVPNNNTPEVITDAGLYVFPVLESSPSYEDPIVLPIINYRRPIDFVWSSSSDRIWTVGLPSGVVGAQDSLEANIMAVDVTEADLTEIGLYLLGLSGACWIEYLNSRVYTSPGVQSDLADYSVIEDGSVDVASKRRVDLSDNGNDTLPLDEIIGGERLSGKRYLYVALSLVFQIASLEINSDGSLTQVARYDVPVADTLQFFPGAVAATTASEQELIDLYSTPSPTSGASPMSVLWSMCLSLSVTVAAFSAFI